MIMRNRLLALSVVVLLGVAPAAAQKIYVDYDRSVDFNSFKTFAWGPTPETSLKSESKAAGILWLRKISPHRGLHESASAALKRCFR